MIWGYQFGEIEDHLARLGFSRRFETDLTVVFISDEGEPFTIRKPNEAGWLPETRVADAFDAAGLSPPGPATGYVD